MRKKRRIIAILLAIILIATGTMSHINILAVEVLEQQEVKASAITKLENKKQLEELNQQIDLLASSKRNLDSGYSPEDVVEIIIELKEDSLLDTYVNKLSLNRSQVQEQFEDYAKSSTGKDISSQLIKSQDIVLNKINILDNNSIISTIYNYTSVLNGFSIKATYGLLENIKNLPEVKSAYVAPTYELIRPTMTESVPFIGADKTWKELGYKGEGTVVAVIDSGLYTTHEAFQIQPTSPRISKDDIVNLLSSVSLSAKRYGTLTANDVFISSKIPYVFDYADKDSNVSGGDSHGTHVAGTVAASGSIIPNENGMKGVAPEAQLIILKVFSDQDKGASTADILAALEDATKLGVDVINMSLGSGAGFTYESESGIESVYNRVVEAGINLVVSAGNSYSSNYNNSLGERTLTENTDTSVVGSPSTYEASLSVASVKNSGIFIEKLNAGDRNIAYTDNASITEKLENKLAGTYEYVYAGLGTKEELAKLDVKGKIALISRGTLNFNDKKINAAEAGALAVVIFNNVEGTISMAIDKYDIPAVSITLDDGVYLTNLTDKKITIDPSYNTSIAGQASNFSSWGVTPDLKLKPEIAAPGEGIYSSVSTGYETMNGTSMASPHIAGAAAIMKQYINDIFGDSLTPTENKILINQILMSTAKPVTNSDGIPYSPRKQGAGMLQVYGAVTSNAYLYVEGQDRTKIELGDDVEKLGNYTFEFRIKNMWDNPISYTIDTTTLTESVKDIFIGESPKPLTPKVTINAIGGTLEGNQLTVGKEEDVIIKVEITLSDADKAYIDSNFPNGEFVEGFVYLNSDTEVDLSIPFMGFYGDWTKAPIMDNSSLYEDDYYSQTTSEAYSVTLGSFIVLGENLLAAMNNINVPLDKNKIAI